MQPRRICLDREILEICLKCPLNQTIMFDELNDENHHLMEKYSLKQLRFASLNHNIYIATDLTHMDVAHAAHAVGPTMCTWRIMTIHLLWEVYLTN